MAGSKATDSPSMLVKLAPNCGCQVPAIANGAVSAAWATTAPRVGTGVVLGPPVAAVPSQVCDAASPVKDSGSI